MMKYRASKWWQGLRYRIYLALLLVLLLAMIYLLVIKSNLLMDFWNN